MKNFIKGYAGQLFPNYNDCVEYHVKPISMLNAEVPTLGLTFGIRDHARQYKKILKRSNSKMESHIIRREYIDGRIASEKEVW